MVGSTLDHHITGFHQGLALVHQGMNFALQDDGVIHRIGFVHTRVHARSLIVLGILVIVGGASVANTISSNVRERRREVGTLMALGATPGLIARMFLLKAWLLGTVGAIGGCVLGLIVAKVLGSQWTGVTVTPLPDLIALATGAALAITTLAALWPARSAAKLDPCRCFGEV